MKDWVGKGRISDITASTVFGGFVLLLKDFALAFVEWNEFTNVENELHGQICVAV